MLSNIYRAGCEDKEVVIYVTSAQLKANDFLLRDIDNLLVTGDVFGLFTQEER